MFASYLLNLYDQDGNRLLTYSTINPITHTCMHFKAHPKGRLTLYKEPHGYEYSFVSAKDVITHLER